MGIFSPFKSIKKWNLLKKILIQASCITIPTAERWKTSNLFSSFNPVLPPPMCSISSCLAQPHFVLLLPVISEAAFGAGANTAFHFAAELAKRGYMIHCVSLQSPACALDTFHNHLEYSLGLNKETVSHFLLSDLTKEICLHKGDCICATASWTLPTAMTLAQKTQTLYPAYFIQDFESHFFPWSPVHAMLLETYAEKFLPIINTPSLAEMLVNIGTGSFANEAFRKKALFFQPAVDRTLFFPVLRSGIKKLFVYTRFGTFEQRNMYQFALEAISRAAEKGVLSPDAWEIHCYGSQGHVPIEFSGGLRTIMLPSLNMKEYAREIRESSLVLYLVLSPHTGYMPLEAAACGVPVITNTYLNKTAALLRGISPLIIPARPTPDSISETLINTLAKLETNFECGEWESGPAVPHTWSEAFAPILPKVEQWLTSGEKMTSDRTYL